MLVDEDNKNLVRIMSHEEKMDYDDITIEETIDEEPGGRSQRPNTFNEAYEDNTSRQQDFRRNFRSYGGSGHGPRVYSFNLGRSMSSATKWKYRIIGGVIALAVIAFLVFVALPVVAVGIVAAMIAYLLFSFFS